MQSRHLIDLQDFSHHDLVELLTLTGKVMADPNRYYGKCNAQIMASLFYEPSTRTQMSFQTAILRLGGAPIGFDNPMTSSVAKGESVKDTIKMVSGYSDLVVMRHPLEGAARAAALYSSCPVINAGDGGHLHPTQTLTDIVTIKREKGRLDHLTIGICGDLKNGRTVHSLIKTMCNYENHFVLISTPELGVPSYIKAILNGSNSSYTEVFDLERSIKSLDILYMTRIQKERFASEADYLREKDVYRLDRKKLLKAKIDLTVMHPLPRVDEISYEIDDDPRAKYFEQADNGMFARMALILYMLQKDNLLPPKSGTLRNDLPCKNPRCITNHEPYLPKTYIESAGMFTCDYCDHRFVL